MRKVLFIILALVLVLALPTTALAARPDQGLKGLQGRAGVSNVAFVDLWEKDPSTWEIVEEGAWGKLKYNLEGPTFDFVFNGHGLTPDVDYTLIYYGDADNNDVWPYATCIATATVNDEGDIHLAGSFDFGYSLAKAKIWLVLSSDVDCAQGKMTRWNPTAYLFEYDVIDYDYTGSL